MTILSNYTQLYIFEEDKNRNLIKSNKNFAKYNNSARRNKTEDKNRGLRQLERPIPNSGLGQVDDADHDAECITIIMQRQENCKVY